MRPSLTQNINLQSSLLNNVKTRSHPEMVGDMPLVTLNFDLSKIYFVHF